LPRKQRRAVGIVRVSQVNGREDDSFVSPTEQRERIVAACERDGLRLLDVADELDVSGGTPIDERTGLRRAVEAIESGGAEVIVAVPTASDAGGLALVTAKPTGRAAPDTPLVQITRAEAARPAFGLSLLGYVSTRTPGLGG